jgi:hypothetical protein
MTRLARRFGAETARPRVAKQGRARSLEAVARWNAVEGCVRETYAALAASWQARRAGSAELRATFARIAEDETRHAALAWSIARWAEARLDARGRVSVERARRAAVAKVYAEIAAPGAEVEHTLGLPNVTQSRALFTRMVKELRVGVA